LDTKPAIEANTLLLEVRKIRSHHDEPETLNFGRVNDSLYRSSPPIS
jgi:hypothetical protein